MQADFRLTVVEANNVPAWPRPGKPCITNSRVLGFQGFGALGFWGFKVVGLQALGGFRVAGSPLGLESDHPKQLLKSPALRPKPEALKPKPYMKSPRRALNYSFGLLALPKIVWEPEETLVLENYASEGLGLSGGGPLGWRPDRGTLNSEPSAAAFCVGSQDPTWA